MEKDAFFATDSDRMSMTDLLPSAPHFYVESIILDQTIVLMIFDVCVSKNLIGLFL